MYNTKKYKHNSITLNKKFVSNVTSTALKSEVKVWNYNTCKIFNLYFLHENIMFYVFDYRFGFLEHLVTNFVHLCRVGVGTHATPARQAILNGT